MFTASSSIRTTDTLGGLTDQVMSVSYPLVKLTLANCVFCQPQEGHPVKIQSACSSECDDHRFRMNSLGLPVFQHVMILFRRFQLCIYHAFILSSRKTVLVSISGTL